jgi:hypothetical protein
MKAHDINPSDENPALKRKNLCFVWMPNASWANDGRLNGYVFTVEGKEGHVSSTEPTRVIPDMFPMDKMFYGTLCIRLPNESTLAKRFSKQRLRKTKIQTVSPLEMLHKSTPKEMEKKLNDALYDDKDFASDGSFAGFYVSRDPEREWEENVWIVVQTGDRDISRSVWYFLKGLYDPTKMNEEKANASSSIIDRTNEDEDEDGEITSKKHIFVRDSISMQETLKRISESHNTISSSVGETLTEDVEDKENSCEEKEEENLKSGVSKTRRRRRRRRRKAVSQEYYSSSSDSSDYEDYVDDDNDDEDEYQEEDTDLLSVEERLHSYFIHPDEKRAWKYAKVLNELYRRTISYLPSGVDPASKGVVRPSYVEPKEKVSWENDVIRESNFLISMERQVKLKRWSIAGKLANILGFDLSLDFNIHPEKMDVDNHVNVVHVTTNTFSFNKKNAKTTYYCGSFCRRDIVGALPVPISPLTGIKMLYGPSSPYDTNDSGEERFVKSTENTKEHQKRSYSVVDMDDDLGGVWSLKNEPKESEDCFGAFPYGTGRNASYLRLSPSDIQGSESDIASRVTRAQQTSIGGVRVIAPNEWGPSGMWSLSGATHASNMYDSTFRESSNSVLFTWNNKRYHSHPKLSRGMYRPRGKNFQIREANLGYKYTRGSLHLQPVAVQLSSPTDPSISS